MRRLWLLLLAFSLGLNASLLYFHLTRDSASPSLPRDLRRPAEPPGREDLMQNHLTRMTRGLGLDSEQVERLRAAHQDLLPKVSSAGRELDRRKRAIGEQFGAAGLEPDGFRAKMQQLRRAQSELDSLVVELMLAEATVLSPEQRARYARALPWAQPPMPPPPRR